MEEFKKLAEISKKLRKECPWDKEQTFETLKETLTEESQEVIEAIEKKDYQNLKEELGDLLHNILFISNLAEEKELFTIEDVIKEIKAKLIRRHPHVFGDKKVSTMEDAHDLWKKEKEKEKIIS